MNLLFIHGSEKVKEDNKGNYYTDGSYSKEVWDRYLNLCDNLSILMKKDKKEYTIEECQAKFNYFDKNEIKFIEAIDTTSSIKNFISFKNKIKNSQTVKAAISKCDAAIIRLPSMLGFEAIKELKKRKIPYFIEAVGCPFDTLWNHSFKGKILSFDQYFKMKNSVKNADYVLYVSTKFMQRRYPTKGNSIGCSDVVINEIKPKKIIKKKKIILGTVAAINLKYKGQQYVIKAIKNLVKKGYDIEYWLIGGGSQNYLEKIARKNNILDRIKFIGPLTHDEVFKKMSEMDIYVQPSNAESHGRVILEAFSVGCPVIGSSTGGIPELLDKECVFKRKNVKSLEKVLEYVINTDLNKISKRNIEFVKDYQIDKLNIKRHKFYHSFIKKVKNKAK